MRRFVLSIRMLGRSMRKGIVTVAIMVFMAVAAYAQPEVVLDMVNASAGRLIDSTMQTINLRADIFNEEVAKVNKLRPLEAENMTKEKVEVSLPAIRDFLSYLDVYRATSDKEKLRIQDSVKLFRSYLEKNKQKKFLKEFLNAYSMDQSAFYKYTQSLTTLYTNVIDLLNFMAASKAEIKDNKIVFTDKAELKRYETIMAKVEKNIQKQATASLAAQKATFEAGQIMQKSYGKLQ